jgi:hypothetical protein
MSYFSSSGRAAAGFIGTRGFLAYPLPHFTASLNEGYRFREAAKGGNKQTNLLNVEAISKMIACMAAK